MTAISDQSDFASWDWPTWVLVLLAVIGALTVFILCVAIIASHLMPEEEEETVEVEVFIIAPELCSFLECEDVATWDINGWKLCLTHADQYRDIEGENAP